MVYPVRAVPFKTNEQLSRKNNSPRAQATNLQAAIRERFLPAAELRRGPCIPYTGRVRSTPDFQNQTAAPYVSSKKKLSQNAFEGF